MTTNAPTSLPSTSGSSDPPLSTSLEQANQATPSGASSSSTMPCPIANRNLSAQVERQMHAQMEAIRSNPKSEYFPKLKGDLVADAIAARAVMPYKVDQGNSGLCGAAAFTSTLAELRPEEYVKLAHDLWFNGKGSVGNLKVEPGEFVRTFDPNDRNIPHADWLVAASIRNDVDAKLMARDPSHYGGTKTYEVYDWLKQAGFKQVHYITVDPKSGEHWAVFSAFHNMDASIANRWYPSQPGFLGAKTALDLAEPTHNLALAKQFIGNDWTIIGQVSEKYANSTTNTIEAQITELQQALGADKVPPDLIEKMRKDYRTQLVGSETNHWAVIKDASIEAERGGPTVASITRYSWGTEATTAKVPMSDFKTMYGGFIAVSDDNQAIRNWKR